ncbi:extracellular solute-binding protein [Pelagibius litoralis]|uniref:Extracellular solute-binding protein n=1 Tax=Pelagibius litoralis TaxID=374515 RepID=A0A967F0E4_9PROT|nr:extracellular solute-binding protein [Pelagibius litoralis]NIA70699.1 extracellular solute-binding protein [Pelagibius litoralis]
MKRRSFCVGTGLALGSLCAFPAAAAAGTPGGKIPLNQLHEGTARAARALAADRDLRLSILLPQGSAANVAPLAEAFTASTGISFDLEETPVDEINSRMIIDTISRTNTFDLALPATFGVPDLVEAGAIVNLDDFAARYEPADFQADALFSLGDRYKDSLYGYQTDGDAYLMFYNRDWLEDAEEQKRFADRHGYPLQVPQTWEQLDAMMAFFQRPDEGRYGGALFRTPNYIAWEFWIRFHAKGFWPLDAELEPQIDNEAGIAALEELLAASKSLYPAARTDGLFANWEAFSQGNMFCNIGWGGTQKYLNSEVSKIKGRLAFGPTPGGEVDDGLLVVPYFNWGWNYTVSSGSRYPEIAYLFALYACSPEMSTRAVREAGGYFDPFRTEHYADPQIVETYSADFLAAHRASMIHSIPDLYLKGQGEYFDALRENLVKADTGVIGAKEALKQTAAQWRQTTRRIGHQSQVEQWAFLRSRYPDNVRKALR